MAEILDTDISNTLDALLNDCDFHKSQRLDEEATLPCGLELPDFVDYPDRHIGGPVGVRLTLKHRESGTWRWVHFVRTPWRYDGKRLVLLERGWGEYGTFVYLGTVDTLKGGRYLTTAKGMWHRFLKEKNKA